jgi:regulator of protease activity HflC (stomatin/prohibitin superfamily)
MESENVMKFVLISVFAVFVCLIMPFWVYTECRIDVPSYHMAVLIKKTGNDIDNAVEVAPDSSFKGVQKEVLGEGRYYYNPYNWDWVVVPQIEIPEGKLGVLVRLFGDPPKEGGIIAWNENEKGIVPEVLRPGRYAINAKIDGQAPRDVGDMYFYHIELFDPVTIPAGYRGIETLLSAPMPEDPNTILSEKGKRGVQQESLPPATYYVNPYVNRINLIDCRSQRYDLSSKEVIGFPTKDGFWVTLEGIVEFRVREEDASKIFVIYNDVENGDDIDQEIIDNIILPNTRSYCRLRGSNQSGRDFISGNERVTFQEDFQDSIATTCLLQGVEVVQALVTKIRPPDKIAEPVRKREIAVRQEEQFQRQIEQQVSEKALKSEQMLVLQKEALVDAERQVVEKVTKAEQEKEVAIVDANQRLGVAKFALEAAQDESQAILARGKADAEVIGFENTATASEWKKATEAFGGDGDEYARFVLWKKLAPSFQDLMINTANSPIMEIFHAYEKSQNNSSVKVD